MKKHAASVPQTREALLDELHTLAGEAEKMVAGASDQGEDMLENLQERFAAAQEQFAEFYAGAKDRIAAGAKSTDKLIRANPYQSAAVALGVGLLIGVLIGRRK